MKKLDHVPELKTDRLNLRALTSDDVESLFAMRSNPEMHYFTDTKPDASIEETQVYLRKMIAGVKEAKWLIWAIAKIETGELIGTISLWNYNDEKQTAELGYGIVPAAQGNGLMQEALNQIVQFASGDIQVHTLEAYTEESHAKSRQLLIRCGFIPTDTIEEPGYSVDKMFNMIIYSKISLD